MYIWAWQVAPFPPERLISSKIGVNRILGQEHIAPVSHDLCRIHLLLHLNDLICIQGSEKRKNTYQDKAREEPLIHGSTHILHTPRSNSDYDKIKTNC